MSYNYEKIARARESTSEDELLNLSQDSDKFVRIALARNKNIPLFILENLSRDEDADVRYYVAGVIHLPTSILERLSKDEAVSVRWMVAQREDIGEEIGEVLSRDRNGDVLIALASNIGIGERILERLSGDRDYEIRKRAIDNINNKRMREIMKVERELEDIYWREVYYGAEIADLEELSWRDWMDDFIEIKEKIISIDGK